MQKAILKARKKSEKKARNCMFNGCQNRAIKSHVLQKNGILREISENNHLIELSPSNPFEIHEKGINDFKSVGINNVYTFHGFCHTHDTEIFKLVETFSNLDFENINQQALFCYRGLCQEIRRKEIGIEWIIDLRKYFPNDHLILIDSLADGYFDGIKNLLFFKTELENCIKSNNYKPFHFETIKIPRIELCISVPLNIGELEIPDDRDYEKWRKNRVIPFTTSFINIFPKEKYSFIICGYHKKYQCTWTTDFIKRIINGTKQDILKELNDLVTLRLEFWAMSPSLFKKISKKQIDKYKDLFTENIYNFSPKLETELNLFDNI